MGKLFIRPGKSGRESEREQQQNARGNEQVYKEVGEKKASELLINDRAASPRDRTHATVYNFLFQTFVHLFVYVCEVGGEEEGAKGGIRVGTGIFLFPELREGMQNVAYIYLNAYTISLLHNENV